MQPANENFFGIMKSEFLYLNEFENIDHFKQELAKYMDHTIMIELSPN